MNDFQHLLSENCSMEIIKIIVFYGLVELLTGNLKQTDKGVLLLDSIGARYWPPWPPGSCRTVWRITRDSSPLTHTQSWMSGSRLKIVRHLFSAKLNNNSDISLWRLCFIKKSFIESRIFRYVLPKDFLV